MVAVPSVAPGDALQAVRRDCSLGPAKTRLGTFDANLVMCCTPNVSIVDSTCSWHTPDVSRSDKKSWWKSVLITSLTEVITWADTKAYLVQGRHEAGKSGCRLQPWFDWPVSSCWTQHQLIFKSILVDELNRYKLRETRHPSQAVMQTPSLRTCDKVAQCKKTIMMAFATHCRHDRLDMTASFIHSFIIH